MKAKNNRNIGKHQWSNILTIGILASHGSKFHTGFSELWQCLQKQTFRDFTVLMWDNFGKSEDWIKADFPEVKYFRSKKGNIGWGAAHNRLIVKSKSKFYLCLNYSQIFDRDFLKKMMTTIQSDKKLGSITPKIYKRQIARDKLQEVNYKGQDFSNLKQKISPMIDAAGLQLLLDLRVIHIGEGQKDIGQFENPGEVFGGSGSCLLLRQEALNKIQNLQQIQQPNNPDKYNNQTDIRIEHPFDETMWMWKEDVDLALRLQLTGYKCLYIPEAVTYYYRTAGNELGNNLLAIGVNRWRQNKLAKLHSSLNQDYLWRKFFDPNRDKFCKSIQRRVIWTRRLRHLWEMILEPKIWLQKKKKWWRFAEALQNRKLELNLSQVQRLEDLINLEKSKVKSQKSKVTVISNPQTQAQESDLLKALTSNPIKLSISIIDRINSAEKVRNIVENFFQPLIESQVSFLMEIFFILNSFENKFSQDLEQKFNSLKPATNIKLNFVRQPQIRAKGEITSYPNAHNWAQNNLATGELRLLINSDIEIKPDVLQRAVNWMEQNPEVGVMACRVVYTNGQVEPVARQFPQIFTQVINRVSLLQKIFQREFKRYHRLDSQIDGPLETDWVCGHFCMIRAKAWQQIKGQDEHFFRFMSDVDMCRQIGIRGWKVVYNPEITVLNKRLPSSSGGALTFLTNKMLRIHVMDAIRYFWKWRKIH